MTMPGHPREPSGTYPILAASPSNGTLPPDEHISCYDDLFYATTEVDELDWRFTWSPSWRTVGTHLRFSDQLLDLSQSYLRKALGLAEQEAIPPIITVHIRHGDFIHQCEAHDRLCLVGPGNFAKAVESIQRRLLDERGLEVSRVFVASDDEDPEFWRDIDERGWAHINHTAEGTSERFNAWYPPLIDTAILSFGMGFVGTASSSFSTLAAWRVMDWNKGITTLVARDG
ncbi:hypothetical protein BKA70DRAFT_217448 [Coprinopsis sp. MPI-PUGE-AT-0042]|nr:hypothetical protein BKA70DRAFT_217448 [Coprinopsis sp. MPI-PUGE-AT-0042]